MSEYLFAYGTLQPGCVPAAMASVVAELQAICEGFVHGVLYDLGGYPGAVPDPESLTRIRGTVMQLPQDASILRRLDEYEGFDPLSPESSEYVRELRTVQMATGSAMECWIYIYKWKLDTMRVIKSGLWPKDRDREC